MRKFFTFLCSASVSVAAAAPKHTIHIEHAPGIWNISNSSRIIRSDGVFVKTNTFGVGDIVPLVRENPAALMYATDANEQNRTASIWFWSTVPVGIVARLATYPLVEWDVISTKTGWIIFGAGITLSIVGGLVSLHYFNNAKYSMYLSIKEYNQSTTAEPGTSAYFGGVSFRLR